MRMRIFSVIVTALMTMVLLGGVSPAQGAPFVERLDNWQVDRINTNYPECDFTQDYILNNIFTLSFTLDIMWTGNSNVYDDAFVVFLYDGNGQLINNALRVIPPNEARGAAFNELGRNVEWVFIIAGTYPMTPVRPWRMVAYDSDGQGEVIGTLIFDPADFGFCEGAPYVGIQTGVDADPIIDTSSQDTAIYNSLDDDGNPSLDVYGIDENGDGYYAFTITEADLASFVEEPPEINTEILTVDNVALYVLTTGEFQLNIGPDEEGKVRVVIFNGLPPTNVYSYDYNVYDILDGE